MDDAFGLRGEVIERAHHRPRYPNYFLSWWNEDQYRMQQKTAQIADGVNQLQRALDICEHKVERQEALMERARENMESRVDMIAERLQAEGVSMKKLPPAYLVEINKAAAVAKEFEKAQRYAKHFSDRAASLRRTIDEREELLVRLELAAESKEIREVLAGMSAGMPDQVMFERVKVEALRLNTNMNNSALADGLEDLQDVEEDVAELPQSASTMILDLLTRKLAQSAPDVPVGGKRVHG